MIVTIYDEDRAAMESVVGERLVEVTDTSGWPTLVFESGARLVFTSECGADPVCVARDSAT